MLILIKEGKIYSPDYIGIKDILIAGDKIIDIQKPGEIDIKGVKVEKINTENRIIIPGIIDPHVHMIGGGGEGGPETRAPEINLSEIISNGVTTLIGCLGTDGTTRHMESLLAKSFALENEGVSTFIYTGSYQFPIITLTGSVKSDLVLIKKIIGAGEIAISDHRSSQPTFEEFARLAAECRVGGMLGGKAGVLHLHVGDGENKLEYLFRLVKKTEIPISQIYPTHINRNKQLLEQGAEFAKLGGYIDITARDKESKDSTIMSTQEAVKSLLEKKVPVNQITISSDSNGSLPRFNDKRELIGLKVATQKTLKNGLKSILENGILELDNAVRLFSTNQAEYLKLRKKGRIKPGYDADLIIIDEEFEINDVFARGKRMLVDGNLKEKGTFEK